MERVQQEQDKRRQHTGSEDSNLVGVLPSATVDVDRRKEGEGKDEGKKLRIKKKNCAQLQTQEGTPDDAPQRRAMGPLKLSPCGVAM